MRAWIVLIASATLAACAPSDRAPKDKHFTLDGVPYHWTVAHGVTGGLLLIGPARADGGNVTLALGCKNLKSGMVGARLETAVSQMKSNETMVPGELIFRAGELVLRTPGKPEAPGTLSIAGDIALPPDYFAALAKTAMVSIGYESRNYIFVGPGKGLSRHFERYCAKLDARQAHEAKAGVAPAADPS